MRIAPARLENWMNHYYHLTDLDLGSSGVEVFTLQQLRSLVGIDDNYLDSIIFEDSCSLGAPKLRKSIAERWGNGNADEVMVTHGSSEAIFLVMQALINEGDEVIALEPCYQQLFSIAESIGCRLKKWSLRFEQDFSANLEDLRQLITSKTRMIIVNFPHNPTGTSITLEEQRALIDMSESVGAYLFWDGAFSELTYGEPPLSNPRETYHRAISIGTLSKGYGLPGLRVGWCFASSDIFEKIIHIRNHITLHISPLVEAVAQKVVENGDILVNLRLQQAKKNLALLENWALQQSDYLDWVAPRGGVTTFLRLLTIKDVDTFCTYLADKYKILLVPGSCFGYSQYVRLGFGDRTESLQKGLNYLTQEFENGTFVK